MRGSFKTCAHCVQFNGDVFDITVDGGNFLEKEAHWFGGVALILKTRRDLVVLPGMPQVCRLDLNRSVPSIADKVPIEILDLFAELLAAGGGNESENQVIASHSEAKVPAFVHEHMLHSGGVSLYMTGEVAQSGWYAL